MQKMLAKQEHKVQVLQNIKYIKSLQGCNVDDQINIIASR